MKKIGIIGSGQVGKTLASGFLNYNYSIMIGSRSEEKQQALASEIGGKIQTGDFKKTAQFGDILILAVKGSVGMEALNSIGALDLKNKIVIDATNPIADAPPQNGVLKFFTSLDKSLMEIYQETFPEVRFVKSFSCIGSGLMVNPHFPKGQKPSMFICGNDETAKSEVRQINELFGFDTEDMGGAEAARAIEPLCMLWCIPGFKNNSWGHAFKLLR
jgi:predicted dinucleotide-binding enzyme